MTTGICGPWDAGTRQMSGRAVSICVAVLANLNAIDWFMMIGLPQATRSLAPSRAIS